MKLNRLAVLTAFALFAAGMSRADVAPGAEFTIDLNDVPGTDGGGWLNGVTFTANINPAGVDPSQFTYGFAVTCLDDSNNVTQDCEDPSIRGNPGGDPTAVESSPFTFQSDGEGGGSFSFTNDTGNDITSLLITANYDNSFFNFTSFTCDPADSETYSFAFCGFNFVNGNDAQIQILFADSIPEPSFGLAFLAGAGLLAWNTRRRKSRS